MAAETEQDAGSTTAEAYQAAEGDVLLFNTDDAPFPNKNVPNDPEPLEEPTGEFTAFEFVDGVYPPETDDSIESPDLTDPEIFANLPTDYDASAASFRDGDPKDSDSDDSTSKSETVETEEKPAKAPRRSREEIAAERAAKAAETTE